MSDADYIAAPPTAELLNSLANARLSIKESFGELLDNALDADAKRVTIEIGPQRQGRNQYLRIEDDGHGCQNLIDMVTLGKHTGHRTTKLGRFGIGVKSAALWLCGADSELQIRSTHDGSTQDLHVNWRNFAKRWQINREWMNAKKAGPGEHGTAILMRPCVRRIAEGKALEDQIRDLGYLYSPGIRHGAQIQIRTSRRGSKPFILQPWELPEFEELIETDLVVDGRGLHIRAGIVKFGAMNSRPGLSYAHEFRIIKESCGLGCGGMDYSNICGLVELDSSWELTTHKDDISLHIDELGAAILAVVRPLLEKAATRGHQLQLAAFDQAVERQLNVLLGRPTRKAVRHPGQESGTNEPKRTNRRHRQAREEQPGATFGAHHGSVGFSCKELGLGAGLGRADVSAGWIILNKSHPFIAAVYDRKNTEALALAALVLLLDAERREERSGQGRMPFHSSGDLVGDLSGILSVGAAVDGRQLLSVVVPQTTTTA
jgi:hypothetical protein